MSTTPKQNSPAWLKAHGFDGLYNLTGDACACKLGDLVPCDEPENLSDCEPGYLHPCDCDLEHAFHIGPDKPDRGEPDGT